MFAGLFGVGGGILFVPTLIVLFGLSQVEAQATSLLAILPAVAAGTWRQHGYTNVRWRAATIMGMTAIVGVELGVLHGEGAPGSDAAPAVRHPRPCRCRPAGLAGETKYSCPVREQNDGWLAFAEEPIAAIVDEIEAADPALTTLVDTPEKLLAFRTFASIRVGIVLGRLLMDDEVEAYDGSETWVQSLLRNPAHRDEIAAEVRAVAQELSDARFDDTLGPDDATRERFRDFARRELGS